MPNKSYMHGDILVARVAVKRTDNANLPFVVNTFMLYGGEPRYQSHCCRNGIEALRLYNNLTHLLNLGEKAYQHARKNV